MGAICITIQHVRYRHIRIPRNCKIPNNRPIFCTKFALHAKDMIVADTYRVIMPLIGSCDFQDVTSSTNFHSSRTSNATAPRGLYQYYYNIALPPFCGPSARTSWVATVDTTVAYPVIFKFAFVGAKLTAVHDKM